MDPEVVDPKIRRCVRYRARRVALSDEQKALINQCRREAYTAKKQGGWSLLT